MKQKRILLGNSLLTLPLLLLWQFRKRDDQFVQFFLIFDVNLIENTKGRASECGDGVGMDDKRWGEVGGNQFGWLSEKGVGEDHVFAVVEVDLEGSYGLRF